MARQYIRGKKREEFTVVPIGNFRQAAGERELGVA